MHTETNKGILHYVLYCRGRAGMCNLLLSIQNALIIARLTRRDRIVFYADQSLFNSSKGLSVFDLFDIDYEYSVKTYSEYPEGLALLPPFSDACFYYEQAPSAAFANGRGAFNLAGLDRDADIGTSEMTLGYYSYLFFLNMPLRDEFNEFVKGSIAPKAQYLAYAQRLRDEFGPYDSVHFRRGDYLTVSGARNAEVTWEEVSSNLLPRLDKNRLVLMHTDEADESYFQPLLDAGYQLSFFEKQIPEDFDDVEKGLISLLVATLAERFIGTMLSTFTGYIHQYRRQHGDASPFLYLYSQVPKMSLKDGEICYEFMGQYSWNRLSISDAFRKTLFFMMEHHECYANYKLPLDYSLKLYPNFLRTEEIDYLTSAFDAHFTDNLPHENRDRAVLYVDQHELIRGITERVIQATGMQSLTFENGMQIFRQYEGGRTVTHSDSLGSKTGAGRHGSVLFYLNDDYQGGCLEFPYLKTRITPSKGDMVCFPIVNKYGEQMPEFSHSSGLITRGTKWGCYLTTRYCS